MKPFLVVSLFLLVTLPARAADPPSTLTPQEAADGWELLFDGKEIKGLGSRGNVTVADGNLVVGGGSFTELWLKNSLGRRFELRLEYRMAPRTNVNIMLMTHHAFGSSGSGWSFNSMSQNANDWHEYVIKGEVDSSGKSTIQSYTRLTSSKMANQSGGSHGMSGGHKTTVRFSVQPGQQIVFRNIKLKTEGVSWWTSPWTYVILLALLLACVAVTVFVWKRLRQPAEPAEVQAVI